MCEAVEGFFEPGTISCGVELPGQQNMRVGVGLLPPRQLKGSGYIILLTGPPTSSNIKSFYSQICSFIHTTHYSMPCSSLANCNNNNILPSGYQHTHAWYETQEYGDMTEWKNERGVIPIVSSGAGGSLISVEVRVSVT